MKIIPRDESHQVQWPFNCQDQKEDIGAVVGKSNLIKRVKRKVTYSERYPFELSEKVAQILQDKGYEIADLSGVKVGTRYSWFSTFLMAKLDHDCIGILKPNSNKSFLCKRDFYIGDLYLDNDSWGADPDQKWVFCIYGTRNVAEIAVLAREFSETFEVDIHMELCTQKTKMEKYMRDVYGD